MFNNYNKFRRVLTRILSLVFMLAIVAAAMVLPGEKSETKSAPAYSAEASSSEIEHNLGHNPFSVLRGRESEPVSPLPSRKPSSARRDLSPSDEAAQNEVFSSSLSDEETLSALPESVEPSAQPSAEPEAQPAPEETALVPIVSEISALPDSEVSELPYAEPGVPLSLPPQQSAELPAGAFTGFESGSGTALSFAWGDTVPYSAAVSDDWFADAAFVGNSLTVGLNLYGHLAAGSFYAATSISVFDIDVKQSYQLSDGSYITLLDALSRKQFKKVYIMLGVNELWTTPATFHERFAGIIDKIAAIQPNADIYIQSILPVSKNRSSSGSSITREKVLAFNAELKALASEKKAFFVDTFAAFADAENYLPSEATGDGVHLNASDYSTWHSYLTTHTIAKAAPKPDTKPEPESEPESEPEESPDIPEAESEPEPEAEPEAEPETQDEV